MDKIIGVTELQRKFHAVSEEAEYAVTGDEDLLTLKTLEAVGFVTPRIFLAAF